MFGEFDAVTTLVRIAASIGVGLVIALFYMYKSDYNKSFVVTLTLLPAIVGAVISIVNGNVGTGVAVMGAFSLVRFVLFREQPRKSGLSFLRWRQVLRQEWDIFCTVWCLRCVSVWLRSCCTDLSLQKEKVSTSS